MEFALWIYKPLEESQIKQLLSSGTDLSVKQTGKNQAPRQPFSGAKAEVVLAGSAIQSVRPVMEYRGVRRPKVGFFSEEPFATADSGHWSRLRLEEEESIGISALHIKGRLYMADNELRDTMKIFEWAAEEPGKDNKGYRTVVFAALQDQVKAEDSPINYRKIVLPLAFVVSYEENYDNTQGMGSFDLVVQQSAVELDDYDGLVAEAAWQQI